MTGTRILGATGLSVVGVAVLAYVAVLVLLWAFQRHLMYFPPEAELASPIEAGVPEMTPVSLRTGDGLTLVSWYAPARQSLPTVLFMHGNAGAIDDRGFKARPLLDHGFGVLLLEWRGFGGNPGQPSEAGLLGDAAAAFRFLETLGVPAGRTVLYGESLGTGVAVLIAADLADAGTPVAGLVLETPYTSIVDVAAVHYGMFPVRLLLSDRFEAENRVSAVRAPLLIIHAEDDEIIPIRLARRLFDRATEPKKALWLREGGHERTFLTGGEVAIQEFLGGIRVGGD